ncbi:MAG: adenylate/guanylate cyclase domain-containing protein [Lacipirellulaceae bacterium]
MKRIVTEEGRTDSIVNRLLSEAAREGELGIAWARLVVGATVTLAWPIIHGSNLVALVPRAVAAFSFGLLGLCWSIFVIWRLRKATPKPALTYVSIAIDAILVNALVLAYVIAPGDSHQSIVEVHGTSVVYLAIVTAGVRLSAKAALFGAIINSVMLIALVTASTIKVDNLKIIGWAEWVTVGVALAGSTVLGVTIATRTSRLVRQAARETLLAESAKTKLGAYLSPEVASVVLKEADLRLGGERQSVAVLFSDLRGFTSYAESLDPEDIVEQLNAYMSVMVDTITVHKGIVDKFMGDGIMAVFGAPVPSEDDADQAILCALAMMRAIDEHNRLRENRGLPKLRHGIGVHYGPVIAGNVGTAQRAAYTVIGDTVNLASRLEGATKKFDVDLLVSEETIGACQRPHGLVQIDHIQVPGREGSVTVFGPQK